MKRVTTGLLLGMITVFLISSKLKPIEKQGTVYFFLAEDCPICRYYSPEMSRLYDTYGEDFSFKGIFPVIQSSSRSIREFGEKYQLPFSLIKDVDQRLAKKYQIQITPEVIVVDHNDELLYQGRIDNAYDRPGRRRRVITERTLEDALLAISEEKKIEVSKTQAVGCYITFLK